MKEKIDTLYLIDDDKIYHFLTCKIIKESNKVDNVISFFNGEEAIENLKTSIESSQNIPDVILLDLAMPIMDGWDFLDEFKKLNQQMEETVTIYVVSSTISPHDIEMINHYKSVKDYIIKPITKARFLEMLDLI